MEENKNINIVEDSSTAVENKVEYSEEFKFSEYRYSLSTVLDTLTRLLERLDGLVEASEEAKALKIKIVNKIEELVEKLA